MKTLLLNLLLTIAWMALTGQFLLSNFIVGFAVAYLILWLAQVEADPSGYFARVPKMIALLTFFLWELIKANLKVAYDVLSPKWHMRPGVVAIPLELTSDLEITLLANLITLTPGTLSLDVSTDRKVLYVHSMYIDDVNEFQRQIKDGFERRIREVFQ
ncbi:Na+/H+ antiporter subunit E [Desulfoferrobacter suflitae]|uniref:Na+/H+ antiporter subunit E n=1 Tax=Desulfoferrobacter suflitae TaxID=2865782 RepID=UPI00216421CF|nr:Na+/H+ antiporter subunit E [Desulfoferrobacter suflitae]MCK8600371.1 Na+/H+ antiporter subunit E [Desulfoferrobacter suflitae]